MDIADPHAALRNILIDCGKDFALSAIILSHAHADAFYGLDDLRHWTSKSRIQSHIDIYVDSVSFPAIQSVFPYLVDTSFATGGGSVSQTKFHVFEPSLQTVLKFPTKDQDSPFSIHTIPDVSEFPTESMDFLKSKKVSLLIIDSLYPFGSYSSHFCFDQVLDLASILRPEIVYIVGTTHTWDYRLSKDFFANHPRILASPILSKISFHMAFDGLILEFA
ncbi:hypothetical protein DI09_37p190 [Mitosporidium daphniae]|uniref:Metallo-beta-lactamase domain-containing protein n=1 Tax=Mitosporidium daphniae TaxID=1485682 RepID=A0A098VQV6_9MICR|nr:uncharacterized protein DI09_37p190 [Mitosporidium daphniae]KGG51382.1 hypothetical protein DI09_37p190 [Mitosporidium daphniae]|eukprot:XP_013237809.1 uncharacterized protein DI09_37p190 [Mitosporidium daphniae]